MAKIASASRAGTVKTAEWQVAGFRLMFREVRQLPTAGTASEAYADEHRYIDGSPACPSHNVE
jgi:hypothetical protein